MGEYKPDKAGSFEDEYREMAKIPRPFSEWTTFYNELGEKLQVGPLVKIYGNIQKGVKSDELRGRIERAEPISDEKFQEILSGVTTEVSSLMKLWEVRKQIGIDDSISRAEKEIQTEVQKPRSFHEWVRFWNEAGEKLGLGSLMTLFSTKVRTSEARKKIDNNEPMSESEFQEMLAAETMTVGTQGVLKLAALKKHLHIGE